MVKLCKALKSFCS